MKTSLAVVGCGSIVFMAGFTTSVQADHELAAEFSCAHCGHHTSAEVRARGSGSGSGWSDEATADAQLNATADAGNVVRQSMLFIACPACGKQQPGATSFKVMSVVFALLAGAAFAAATSALVDDDTIAVPIAFGFIISGSVFWRRRRAWADVSSRVRFVD